MGAPRPWQSGHVPASFEWRDFDVAGLARRKQAAGETVALCIPARNEEATVGGIVALVHQELVLATPLVDELVVVDDGSYDATAEEAASAGATVIQLTPGRGKGQAMRRGLEATSASLVAYCDADLYGFTSRFVVGLVGPLLADPATALVKAHYRRPLDGVEGEGGRVTELVAKPLLKLLFPQLVGIRQPLAGEWSSRREVLEPLDFASGYGVELGVLLDVATKYGLEAIAQCDLGERRHRNRPLSELSPMAETVMALGLQRAGLLPPG